MISTLIGLIPAEDRGKATRYAVLAVGSTVLRATSCLLLVPLVSALFSATPADAYGWLGALTAVTALAWAVDAALARLGFTIGFALLGRTHRDTAERLTRVPLGWFTGERTATARRAVAAGGPELVGLVVNLLTPLLSAVLLPVVLALGLLVVAWPVGVAAALAVPALLFALWAGNRVSRAADAADARAHSAVTERVLEFARTQQALRAARRVDPARSAAGAAVTAQRGTTLRLLLLQVPGQLLFGVAAQIGLLLLAGTVAVLAVRGDLPGPEAVALVVVAVRFLEPFTTLAELAPALETVRGSLDDIRAVRTADAEPEAGQPIEVDVPPGIEFRGVTFGYGGTPVVDGLSFTVGPGTTTAIVGPSGSGKSTVLALLAGLHQPDSGRILIGGVDTTALPPAERRRLCSMVFQHPYLFTGGIRDNIRAGDPTADEAAVDRAAALARVDRIADGAAQVGEAGTALSGGERQRVTIARALLSPAPVLLVDEATSALDTENEAAITATLADDAHPRTRLIVAHRLNAIRTADHVLYLEDGAVVEQGTIAELTARGGRFAEFRAHHERSATWRVGRQTTPAPE
ncbi:ABC transporter ATP-binding protein [Actinosynnema sp. NPDC047251]|uniref:Iron import ATP-binding/permease protein IrtB n=1 Tax=Saccharothrix espanaensis (strain ATCC 51144 / DSM 44229 / JCM 9112 / NBRC 15066 / NRRL 15764) TaxID=1179773 RepID=K0JUL7_SACES|nr:ABC transporter ATP-binding protein [Saccharothrix espanaensis]CCH29596.1 Iron import ATP-binding/permease protein IrtB [Saccharothrix espanaensis DSM 44229]